MNVLRRTIQAALLCQPLIASGETLACLSFHHPPWIQEDAKRVSGLTVDVVTTVLQKMGHTVETKVLPLARVLENVKAGRAGCVLGLPKSAEYERFVDFASESIAPQVVYFYARRYSPAVFTGDFSSVRDFRVGTAFKVHYGPRFEEARSRLVVDEALTLEQNFLKLAAGRIDLVPADAHMAASILASPALRKYAHRIVRLPVPTESVPTYVAFSKSLKFTRLREEFDVVLKGFLSSHEYSLLLSRYGLDQHPQPVVAANPNNECNRICCATKLTRNVNCSEAPVIPPFHPPALSSNLHR